MNYEHCIVKGLREIPPSGIRKYFDLLTDDTISLGVGEPDFPTPERIRQAALARLATGRIAYSSNAGMPELRSLICRYLKEFYSLSYTQDQVLITVGTSQAIDLALRTVISPGDEVIVPEPTYVAYTPGIVLAGGVPKPVITTEEHRFKLTPEALKAAITDKTKVLLFPFPNNPTGGIMEKEELEEIAAILRDTDIVVITDEIYAELTFNGKRHVSLASIDGMYERTIVLNGFSKAFSMTGWRVGYAAGPGPLIDAMTKLHQFVMLSAPTPAQYAAIAALEQGFEDGFADSKAMIEEYGRRREYLMNEFNRLGLTCNQPEGAFYLFPCIKSTGLSSEEFCDRLLLEADVCVVPGTAFGPSGEGYVRCCYATSMEDLKEAVRRIEGFLQTL